MTHGVKRVKDRDASSGRRTRLVVSELKTPKSRRTLALTPEMHAKFRQHRARQAEAQMAAGAVAGAAWLQSRLQSRRNGADPHPSSRRANVIQSSPP